MRTCRACNVDAQCRGSESNRRCRCEWTALIGDGWSDGTDLGPVEGRSSADLKRLTGTDLDPVEESLGDGEQEAQGSDYECFHPRVDKFHAVGMRQTLFRARKNDAGSKADAAATSKVEAPPWYIQDATAICVETARRPVRDERETEKKLEGLGILHRAEVKTEVPGEPMVIWPAGTTEMHCEQWGATDRTTSMTISWRRRLRRLKERRRSDGPMFQLTAMTGSMMTRNWTRTRDG